ncbi:hypothetical protein QFC21_001661 [Naganishia friedmannii]|uniref:Uncharacterized protein n=1 Tax=Naganishia friedmannii TaxID=89922 RepID=A0ACC2W0T4_9TREE|nr:hypothetical protein QFC21_001661 [Naganishia friedmannii]
MHIFITGASGVIGSHTLRYILGQGHTVTATDIVPLPKDLELPPGSIFVEVDCTDFRAVENAMLQKPCDGVIHLGAIANPRVGSSQCLTRAHITRTVHNVNVTASYNVMRTAADQGIKRIVQASSVNATGLLYSHDSRRKFEELPLTEQSPAHPEDPYNLWSCLALDAAARACLLGLTANESSFLHGHEAFYILHDNLTFGKACREIAEGFYDDATKNGVDPDTVTAKELVQLYYPGTKLREGWWTEGNERRGFYDTSKAKKMLGWYHEK